ncbi:PREDICTED: mucin-5AC-like [Acropora digitifera]|uniref:mucin-5AC-like n=1 Tax=Acropora digitifera TaxID=70779 RepID=UPI00077ADCA8|nr:PREDICTED: mucin-5AC-like [Acropora digitifera]
MDDKQPRVKSIENQPALITSTLPFVRALNFAAEKETFPKKRAPKKGSKKKSTPKQFINSNGQSETTKKAESNDAGQAVAKKLSRQSALPTSLEPSFPITSSVVNSIVTSAASGIGGQILPRQAPAVVTIPTSSSSSSPLLTVNSTHDLSPVDGNLGGPSFSPATYARVAPSPLLPSNHVPIVTTTGLAPNNTITACSTSTTVDSTAIATSFRASKQHPSHNSSTFAPTLSSPYTALATNLDVSKAYSDVTSKSVFAASSGSDVAPCVPTISCPATENLISHSTGLCQAALSDHSTVDIIVPSKSSAEDPALSQGGRTFKASSGSTTSGFSDESLQLIQASSLLETLAQQCTNDSVNSPTSREDAVPVADGVVNTKGQSFNENSASCLNTTITKDSSTISDENREGSSCANVMVQESECVEASLQNPPGNQSDCTSSLTFSDSYCRGYLKENSLTSRSNSPNNRESKLQGTSTKRQSNVAQSQKNVAQSQKKKKTKLLRPAKRLKTREEGINFPTDLNVEEFLATLRYEVQ